MSIAIENGQAFCRVGLRLLKEDLHFIVIDPNDMHSGGIETLLES